MAASLALAVGAGTQGAMSADQQDHAGHHGPIKFDLPAQSLVSALESYSIATGWQVIYDASLATGRRSASVEGDFAPADALRMLLAGTGLVPHYMAADGVMLVADPMANRAGQQAPVQAEPIFGDYYGRIQASLKEAFCLAPQIRSGAYRIALGFWIGPAGTVTRMALLGSTGRADIDERFAHAVRTLAVGAAPPIGFAQPVVVLVTPDLMDQCPAPGTASQQARAQQ